MSAFSRWAIGIMCGITAVMFLSMPFTFSMPGTSFVPVLIIGMFLSLVVASCVRWRGRRMAGRIAAGITALTFFAAGLFMVVSPAGAVPPPGVDVKSSTWLDRLPACLPMVGV